MPGGRWLSPPASARPDHQRGGDRGDALTPAGQAEPVGGGGGHADRSAGQRLAHHLLGLGATRRDPRPVPDHLHRDVADDEARLADQPERLAQQGDAGRARPFGPGGAEVLAEIAESSRRQQRGADRVRRHVAV